MLRYFTAGETHGKCLTVIIEGMPSGVEISLDEINEQLAKRQQGYGRGGRMKIEKDTAKPQYIETIWGVGYRFKV